MPTTHSARRSSSVLLALRALRAPQWLHFVGLPLAGLDPSSARTTAGITRAVIGMGAAASALAYAYGLNAVADRASDVSVAKNPLAGAHQPPSTVAAAIAASAMTSVLLGLVLGRRALVLVVISLIAGSIYSAGPRLKSRPVLGLIFNTLIFAPLLFVSAGIAWPATTAALAATFVGLLVQSQLLHESADASEDTVAGARTTALVLGARATIAVVVATGAVFAFITFRVAPSRVFALAASAALGTGALVAVVEPHSADARRLHRRLTGAAGAIVFALGFAA